MNDERPVELSGLYADRTPSNGLEERVVADYLGRRGVGKRASGRAGWIKWAAALVLFTGGFGLARVLPSPASPSSTGPIGTDPPAGVTSSAPTSARSFMLLLFEGPAFGSDRAPDGSFAAEYAAWARDLASTGAGVRGDELGPARIFLWPESGAPEGVEAARLGGYFVVEADDLDEARRIAETHPHLGHGGWIEVAEMR